MDLLSIFTRKLKAQDKYHSEVITPDMKTFNSRQDIKEAQDTGISIRIFGDTSDKLVFTPTHLGYKYYYVAKDGDDWGCCRDNWEMDLVKINSQMFQFGKELAKKYQVWFVYDDLHVKGYNDCYAFSVNEVMDKSYRDFLDDTSDYWRHQNVDCRGGVLFVFGIDLDNEIKNLQETAKKTEITIKKPMYCPDHF